MKDPLVDLMARELPAPFVVALQQALVNIYEEAHERAFRDPAWERNEGSYIQPHFRHVLFEAQMLKAAKACGLPSSVEPNASGNYFYRTVRAGKILLTGSAVTSSDDVVRPAEFRKQHAAVNDLFSNPTLPIVEPPDLAQVDTIYAIIVHAPLRRDRRQCGYAAIGIPSADTNEWVVRRTLAELATAQSAANHIHPEVPEDLAKPVKKRDEDAGNE